MSVAEEACLREVMPLLSTGYIQKQNCQTAADEFQHEEKSDLG